MTDIFDVPDDGTYDGLPPLGCYPHKDDEEERVRYFSRLHSVTDDLTAAAGGGAPAYLASAASFALNSIRLYAFDRSARLRPQHRDELLQLLIRAKGNISCSVIRQSTPVNRRAIDAAIEAVACQIVFWAEAEPWKTRPADLLADVRDRARWLQNELHNACLELAISDRQRARTVSVVERIKVDALAGGRNVA